MKIEDETAISVEDMVRDYGSETDRNLGEIRGRPVRVTRYGGPTLAFIPEGWVDRLLVWGPIEGYYGGAYGWLLAVRNPDL
jgi:hypothetical protein